MRLRLLGSSLLTLAALTACNLAPDFTPPNVEIPPAFKHAPAVDDTPITDGQWAPANPAMAEQFGKDRWWRVFDDPILNRLIAKAYRNSPSLEAARERLVQARAFTESEEARLYPEITADGGVSRERYSGDNPNFPPGVPAKPFTLYNANVTIDYGLDVFGRARNLAFAALMREESAAELYRAARITLAADIAESYYRLRGLQAEADVLTRTLALRRDTVKLTRARYEIGDVSDLELARAEGEAAATQAELFAVEQQRAVIEHTLALLTGEPPASFAIKAEPIIPAPPAIPAGIPATLLERRPDIAQATREMAATNAEIGYARGAFFPAIDIGGRWGYQSSSSGNLFDWSSRTWLLGPASGTLLSVPIFSGGRNSANLAAAKSRFREAVATYRAQVLTAYKEAEDALSGVRTTRGQAESQQEAVRAAKRADRIARLQYENGYASSLERIDAERSLLVSERALARAHADQYVATITLIRALGGGWDVPATPTPPTPAPAPSATEADEKPSKPGKLKVKTDATLPVATDKPIAWQALTNTETPAPKATRKDLPFAVRHPDKPIPGIDD